MGHSWFCDVCFEKEFCFNIHLMNNINLNEVSLQACCTLLIVAGVFHLLNLLLTCPNHLQFAYMEILELVLFEEQGCFVLHANSSLFDSLVLI